MLNRTDGVVDKLRLRLKDVLGVKQVPGNPNFRNGVAPHIWEDSGKVEWYAFRPSAADVYKRQDKQIDKILAINSDAQAYKQAGNSVTVTVIEAIGRRIRAVDEALRKEAAA